MLLLDGNHAHITDIPRAAAEDVPTQVGQVSFVLERGSKVQYTDAATVDTERRAYWHQVLKLVRGPVVTPCWPGRLLSLPISQVTSRCADSYHGQGFQQDLAQGVCSQSAVGEVK